MGFWMTVLAVLVGYAIGKIAFTALADFVLKRGD